VASHRVFELFHHYREHPFILVEPGGNSGDYLIYEGAQVLADRVGLHWIRTDHDSFMRSKIDPEAVVYLHGSGGFNPWWSGTPMLELRKAVVEHSGVVIQGPSTYHDNSTFLRESVIDPIRDRSASAVHLMARERVSLSALEAVTPSWVELSLDHDTAFNVPSDHFGPEPDPDWPTLYALREDKESASELAGRFLRYRGDPPRLHSELTSWWAVHCRAHTLVTDRLHSSIAGSILGRPTTLIANSYFKNRAVWEFSLEARGVQFVQSIDAVVPAANGVRRVAASVLNMRPVRRGLQRIQGMYRDCSVVDRDAETPIPEEGHRSSPGASS
jgi:exopolysaccharide biosynthesis predicted pyruvyltransferase EpsI